MLSFDITLVTIGICKQIQIYVDNCFILKLPSDGDFLLSGWEYQCYDSKDSCKNLIKMTDKLLLHRSYLIKMMNYLSFGIINHTVLRLNRTEHTLKG